MWSIVETAVGRRLLLSCSSFSVLLLLLVLCSWPPCLLVAGAGGGASSESLATPIYEDEVQTVGYEQSEWTWRVQPGARQGPTTCVPIPANLSLCRGISYDRMRLPNLLEHDSVRELTQASKDWIHLLSIRCHPDTQVFLCSLFAPVCFDRPIWPCRSLCRAVQAGCEARMASYGFAWPEMLHCDKFPPDNDLCIKIISNASDDERCSPCNQSETLASIFDNFCHASYAMQIRAEKTKVVDDHLEIAAAKSKTVFKAIGLSKQETRDRMTFLVENFTQCNCTRTGLKRDGRKLGQFLVMGHKDRARLPLTFVMKINRKSCEMREALRAIRNAAICKNTSKAIDKRQQQQQQQQQGAVFTNNDKNQSESVANALMSSRCASKKTLTTAQRTRVTRRMTGGVTAVPPPRRRVSATSRSPGVTPTMTMTKRGRSGVTTAAAATPSSSAVTEMTVGTPQTLPSVTPTSTIKEKKKKKGKTDTKQQQKAPKTTHGSNNRKTPKDNGRQ